MPWKVLFTRWCLRCRLSGLAAVLGFMFSCSAPTTVSYTLQPHEKALLKPGDIILRHGSGALSHAISEYLDEELRVSHVGLISRGNDGQLRVIQSISETISDVDGMQDEALDSFVSASKPFSIIVVRFNGVELDPSLAGRIEERALEYLRQKVPFDHKFCILEQHHFFCSELIYRLLLEEAGVDIFKSQREKSRREILRFSVFLNPEFFSVVVNHHADKDQPLRAAW